MIFYKIDSSYNYCFSFGTIFMSLVFSIKLRVPFFIRNFIQKNSFCLFKKKCPFYFAHTKKLRVTYVWQYLNYQNLGLVHISEKQARHRKHRRWRALQH